MSAPGHSPTVPSWLTRPLDETEEFFAAARRVGKFPLQPSEAQQMRVAGWTTDVLGQVAEIAEWALTVETTVGEAARRQDDLLRRAPMVGQRLLMVGTELARATRTAETRRVLPWVALAASATTDDLDLDLEVMLVAGRDDGFLTRQKWLAVGRWGPLAYAAGLTVDEALTRSLRNRRQRKTLGLLAGLRGWRLAPWVTGERSFR